MLTSARWTMSRIEWMQHLCFPAISMSPGEQVSGHSRRLRLPVRRLRCATARSLGPDPGGLASCLLGFAAMPAAATTELIEPGGPADLLRRAR